MKRAWLCLLLAAAFGLATVAPAQAQGKVEVQWLGHATVKITSVNGKVIVLDPFLRKNPKTPGEYKDLKALGKVDLILLTHGHGDHIVDAPELSKITGATVVGNYELTRNLVALGLLASDKIIAMNKGGTVEPIGPGIKINMVPAEHSSSLDLTFMEIPKSRFDGIQHIAAGAPVGYVIELENGFKIYQSGDTDVFGDMSLIHKQHKPDLALICIGGYFTMGPQAAALALTEHLKPKQVIPIHYETFPIIKGNPADMKKAMGSSSIKVLDVKPGDALKF